MGTYTNDSGKNFMPGKALVYVPIQLSTNKEIRHLTLFELLSTLKIDAPTVFMEYRDYTLFLYSQSEEAKVLCAEAEINDASCYGPRLGFVIKLPTQTEGAPTTPHEVAFNVMSEWEETIVEDVRPLMLSVVGEAPETTFSKGRHGDLDTHYINLPISTISLDWILTNTYLVIATSKDAARTAVDNINEQ